MKFMSVLPLALLCANPALAQAESADSAWHHQWTGLAAPAEFSGFTRVKIEDLTANQLDVMVTYFDRPTRTLASIFVFRPGLADVSVWAERAMQSMLSKPEFSSTAFADGIAANFTPKPGGGENSGYLTYGALHGGDGKSAGLALFPHDGWLVKVRMSSAELTRDELAQRLIAFVSAIELPRAQIEYPPASDIAACEKPLKFARNPRRVRADMTQMLLIGTVAPLMRMRTDKDGKPVSPIRSAAFCRDQSSTSEYGIYRARGSSNSYLIAHGDAGVTTTVGKNDIASLLGGRNDYWVMVSDVERISVHNPYTGLPSPETVIAGVRREGPVSAVEDPPAGGTNIILSSDAISR